MPAMHIARGDLRDPSEDTGADAHIRTASGKEAPERQSAGSANRSFRIGPIASVNIVQVKARVYVTFKQSVLDPQGQTIRAALNGLGHKGIEDVRQGKFFEITLDASEDLDAIARDVLSNPVIEDYRIEKLG